MSSRQTGTPGPSVCDMAIQETKSVGESPVILVGNPNVGKSALFGALSGRYVEVSNYPGTTVDYVSGVINVSGLKKPIFDSPGADTLSPVSEDEKVTRDLILDHPDSPVICVIDSKNLQRGLVLLSQLAELGKRTVVALNMSDEASAAGMSIDAEGLSRILGVPVIPTVAIDRRGVDELRQSLSSAAVPNLRIDYGLPVENAVSEISRILQDHDNIARGLSINYLSGPNGLPERLIERVPYSSITEIGAIRSRLESGLAEPVGFVIAKARNDTVKKIVETTLTVEDKPAGKLLKRIGELSCHPYYGIPMLAIVLLGIYYFVGVFGAQTLVGLLENGLFGSVINPLFARLFSLVPSQFVRDLFVGQYGVITMAITYALALILPIVTTFFIAFGLLEDSGYLPRVAFMVDRIFKKIGLNGRAVLPMILGLGCDTMAVLTTRILSTKKEKILVTFLLALAIPCSAQLGVTLGILGSISGWGLMIWLSVVCGVLFLVGYISSKVIPGRSSDFILEIPPLRLPGMKNVVVKTLMRLEWYLREAVPLFVLGTLILFVLDRIGMLVILERWFSPIATGILGLPERSAEAFILGFLRRDYGAAGFKILFDNGLLDPIGAIVAMTTITLFVPCIANFFIMIKERGFKTALAMVAFIVPFAIMVGGLLNLVLRSVGIWW
jgi:ferrous iron transport protein B